MQKIILKQFSIAFLSLIILLPLNLLAQSNVEQLIKQYEQGTLTNYTATEKQIISEYLDSWQTPDNISLIKNYPIDATFFLQEDFTGQVLPTGWTNVDNGVSGFVWVFNNPGSRSITGSFDSDFAIFDADNFGSGNTYDATLTTSAIDLSTAGATVTLGYDEQFHDLGSTAITEISSDGVTWTTLNSHTGSVGYPNPPVYTEYDISAYSGQSTVYVRWTYGGGWDYWWAIDNVVVYEPDPTPLPATLVSPPDAGTNISAYTSLNWLPGGGFPPTGYRVYFDTNPAPTTLVYNGPLTSYTPTSALAYNTTYYWEVIPYNDDGDATGTVVWSFTTGADPTVTLPYTENFDGVTAPDIPYGWLVENTNGDAYEWVTSSFYGQSSPNAMYIRWNSSLAMDDWFFSPPVQLTGGVTYAVEFSYYGSSYGESLELMYGTSPSSAGMTGGQIFDDDGFTYSTYTDGAATFTPTTTGTYFVGWHGYSGANFLSIKVDDITIKEAAYGTLNGTITDCGTTANLEGATVTAGANTTTTNASGFYEFTSILVGTYDVTASLCGYVNKTITDITVVETGTTTQDFCMDEFLVPPVNLSSSVTGQDVNLTWQAPGTVQPDQFIQWDDGVNYTSIGTGGAFVFDVAHRFSVADIIPYDGMYITNVVFYPAEATATYTIKIWQGNDASSLSEVYSQAVPSPTIDDFNDIALTTSYQICGTQELWIGYNIDTPTGYPAGCDDGPPIPGKGFMINEGAGWYDLAAAAFPDLQYNWNIAGYVSSTADGPNSSLIYSYALEDDNFVPKSPLTDYDISKINSMNSTPFTAVESSVRTAYKLINENSTLVTKLQNGDGPDATLTGYNVYRDDVLISTNQPGLSYNDPSLAYGAYSYKVTAVYTEGESMPVAVNVPVFPTAAGIPFTEGFETWPNDWIVENGTETNQWFVSSVAGGNGGSSQSAFVSSDGGTTWSYDNTATSIVHLVRNITFSGSVGAGYNLQFYWKGNGESGWDDLNVYIIDPADFPTVGEELPTTDLLGVFSMQGIEYAEENIILSDAYTGSEKLLVFSWVNDGSLGADPPVSIDDVSINVLLTGNLNGTITDCNSTDPLEDVYVTAGTFSTTTNSSGFYEFADIPNGTYDVTATLAGYSQTTETDVVVTAGATTTQDICLDQPLYPPNNLEAVVLEQDVSLTWDAPFASVLAWHTGLFYYGIRSGSLPFETSARFSSEVLGPLAGITELREVEIAISSVPDNVTIKIYDEGTPTTPGTLLYSEDVTSQIVASSWNLITLATPVPVSGNDMWIGYAVTNTAGVFCAGSDNGPGYPDGNWINTDGGGWEHLDISVPQGVNWDITGALYYTGATSPVSKPIVLNSNSLAGKDTESRNNNQLNKDNSGSVTLSAVKSDKPSVSYFANNRDILLRQIMKGELPTNRIGGIIDAPPTGYNVYRNGSPIATSITNLFYDDSSVPVGFYTYGVTAQYAGDESGPAEVSVVVGTPVTTTVFPQSADYWTGTTTDVTKTEVSLMIPESGTGGNPHAWAKFDLTSIPDGAIVTSVTVNWYINSDNCPYFNINALPIDPVTADAATLYSAITGGVLYTAHNSCPDPEWNSVVLGGTANADLEASLTTNGWFALSFYEYESSTTPYTFNADGWAETNPPYLEVEYLAGGATTFPLSVSVVNGWNMVSAPGNNTAGMAVGTWWPNQTGTVWGFNGSQYVAKTEATPGEGYWMKNVGAEIYDYPAIEIVTHAPITVVQGWNMIGGYETSPTITALKLSNSQITGTVWGFNGSQYVAATNLVPGYSYWVKTTTADPIVIPDLLAKGNGEVVELFKEDWGKIIITDALGRNFTLYAVKGEVDLDQYEMPPMPPGGIFDMRFSSGRIAEDINSSIKSIDMTGIVYPLTVKVENMDINLQDETGNQINENIKSGEMITISNQQINKLMVTGKLIPDVYALEQNYPNPFNPSTVIEFSLPEDVSNVQLTIYDVLGQKITQLVNTSLKAGRYSYQWNAGTVATGLYIYELRTDKFVSVKKMMFLK